MKFNYEPLDERYDFWNTGTHPITGKKPVKTKSNLRLLPPNLKAEYNNINPI